MLESFTFENVMSFFGLCVGVVATLIGSLAMITPKKMSEAFGIPTDDKGTPFVFSLGARDVFVGAVGFILWYQAQWHSLGYVCFAIAFVAVSDASIVFKHGNKKAAVTHLFGFVSATMFGFLFLSL
jgi:hypothetical protein